MLITKQQWSLVLLFLLWSSGSEAYLLDPGEANVLKQISKELSEKGWDFNVDPCSGNEAWNTSKLINGYNNTILCNYCNNGACHVTHLFLKAQNLSGFLPPSLAKLPYLQMGDFSRNCLRGTIPKEWTSLRNLSFLSVSMNNLSGPIPDYVGDLTSLEYLSIESNLFSGRIPPQLGNLVNLVNLTLNANNLTGSFPVLALSKLTNLKELRISSNNFEGKLPDLHHWPNLVKLEIQGSGLEGPIPPSISVLKNITELRISDLSGHQGSKFPVLENLTALQRLMLRSCNISGQIPPYLNRMEKLQILDLSFNRLQGNIPDLQNLEKLERMELISNFLSGDLPSWVNEKNRKFNADVSYNNFNESSIFDTCIDTVNLYRSFHSKNGTSVAKCLDPCGEEQYSFYVNCGGKETTIDGNKYEADEDGRDASKFVTPSRSRTWGTSTSGDFWDVSSGLQHIFIAKSTSNLDMRNSELYTTARLSPLSLTYFARCLKNGNYTVILHFAEIVIRGDISYYSLGRRIFDVYVQEKLVLKDFNIAEEAKGVDKVHNETFENVIVRNKILEIRFHWSGKGTASVPIRGNYGPLISAISVNSEEPPRRKQNGLSDKTKTGVAVGVGLSVVFLTFVILIVLRWMGCFERSLSREKELKGLDLQTGFFTIRQIKAATNNFDPENKIGEGGFGPVYKGMLLDGSLIAVKQLSSKSRQGNREFVNEIGMISGLNHPNLVRLYGCCIEGNQLLLVYEYMANNSLARALFGPEEDRLNLNWPTRNSICIGIAKGLVFLHEESTLKVVHRDIKTTNILLDKDLNPKISDFGLAKLDEEENTHISTRIAGTVGYMAPEYALWGYLTYKADVYSFGVVAMEIVAGKSNMKYRPNENYVCLVDWAIVLQQKGNLMELVDPRLEYDFDKDEAIRMIKVAILCTNPSPALRPTMSAVVSMLEGKAPVHELLLDPSIFNDEERFKALREQFNHIAQSSPTETQCLIPSSDPKSSASLSCPESIAVSGNDLYQIGPESLNATVAFSSSSYGTSMTSN